MSDNPHRTVTPFPQDEQNRSISSDESGTQEQTSLTAQTLRGATWTYLSTLINAGLQVLVTAILARLLAPEAFGLIVMASLVLKFAQFFAQLGITQAIVQRRSVTREHVRAGFCISILVGALFAILVWFSAPVVATAFGSRELGEVLRIMGLSFFITGLSATASSILIRDMRFRSIALTNVAAYTLGYAAVGVVTAFLGWGVWSLVAAALTQSLLVCAGYNLLGRPAAKPIAKWRPYRELLLFGSTLSLAQFVEFVTNNLDLIVVGRVSGSAALGYYSRALNLTAWPMYYMSWSLSQVLFPSFSRVQHDTPKVSRTYTSLIAVFAGIGLPVALGLSGAAREVVHVLLGPQWDPAIPVVRVMGVASGAITLSRFGVVVLQATARLRERLALRVGQLALFAVLLLVLARFGLVGYATAFAASETAFHIALAARLAKSYRMTLRQVLQAYWPGLVGAAVVFSLCILESWLGRLASLPSAAVFAIQLVTGMAVLGWVVLRARDGHIFRILRALVEDLVHHPVLRRMLGWLSALSSSKAEWPDV